MIHGLLATLMTATGSWACGGPDDPACTDGDRPEALDPSESAKRAELIGLSNCSWTTAMMAERVLDEGVPYTYVGHLIESHNELASRVAAPYTVGPNGRIHVVANEVLDLLDRQGSLQARLELQGKVLEVDGVRYLVVTTFSKGAS
ncbi:MAG TPA: hypothetical protein ENK18_18720 [Deltaproteobacteria bacterium]|nr:hypothetical protein [Deltaproteobacteria bacterium]